MAGSGKTTLVQQMNVYMSTHKKAGYLINLDPAVRTLPYDPNIDIRDTVCSFPAPYSDIHLAGPGLGAWSWSSKVTRLGRLVSILCNLTYSLGMFAVRLACLGSCRN
jgi:hypothetical protein